MKLNILEPRLPVSPVEFPWAKTAFEECLQNPWSHTDVSMGTDTFQWNSSRLSDVDRECISKVLRGFTVIEEVVGDHWANVSNIIKKPEITAMCRAFSAQEWVHAYAYDLLETSIGIMEENWKAFQLDQNALKKLKTYTDFLLLDEYSSLEDISKLAKGLAVFGGCAEGVSLFGNFSVLLSYTKMGVLPGMNQILTWSVRDENLHSMGAIALYKEIIAEYPEASLPFEEAKELFQIAVELEESFLAPVFVDNKISSGMLFSELQSFLRHRANLKLKELGFPEIYRIYESSVADWFYPTTSGTPINDFFIQRHNGGAYAGRLTQDFESIDFNF